MTLYIGSLVHRAAAGWRMSCFWSTPAASMLVSFGFSYECHSLQHFSSSISIYINLCLIIPFKMHCQAWHCHECVMFVVHAYMYMRSVVDTYVMFLFFCVCSWHTLKQICISLITIVHGAAFWCHFAIMVIFAADRYDTWIVSKEVWSTEYWTCLRSDYTSTAC